MKDLVVKEIAPLEYSGKVQAFHTVGITGGELLGYIISYLNEKNGYEKMWHAIVLMPGVFSVVQILLLLLIFRDELPTFLLRKMMKEECGKVLAKIYPDVERKSKEFQAFNSIVTEVTGTR